MNKTLEERFLHLIQKEKKLQSSTSATNLPSISMNQLEKQVSDIRKRKNFREVSDDSAILNSKQLNVCSPFYDRMKTHKQNCKCPYHRKKRLEVLPVRHSVKTGQTFKKSVQRLQQSQSQIRIHRFSNKEIKQQKITKITNKSFHNIEEPFVSQTQNFVFKPKIQTRNLSYEMFLKECQFHLLRKKGFSTGKPQHVVRKGLKEIFGFINNHLDYSVEKMTEWINGIEKDRDYGEFYIERFREMKKNYEVGLKKNKNKGDVFFTGEENEQDEGSCGFQKSCNSSVNKFKSKQGLNALYDANGRKYKTINGGSIGGNQGTLGVDNIGNLNGKNSKSLSNKDGYFDEDGEKKSQKYLNSLIGSLKQQETISKQASEDLMNLQLQQFKQIFHTLQNNIVNNKYSNQMLLRLDSCVLNQLIKMSSMTNQKYLYNPTDQNNIKALQNGKQKKNTPNQNNFEDLAYQNNIKDSQDLKNFNESLNPKNYQNLQEFSNLKNIKSIPSYKNIPDLQEKLNIIKKTQQIIRKKISRKSSKNSNLSEKDLLNVTHTSKNFTGSKRNTGNTPNQQNAKSKTGLHSKKSSNGESQFIGSQQKLIDSQKQKQKNGIPINQKYGFTQDEKQFNDQNLTQAQRKRLKALGLLGPHIRRSKLLKPEDEFRFLRQAYLDDQENDLQFRKRSIELHRGHFTKAEKYLFQLNMGKTIIKNDDSIFTAKRKMRVIKLLLNQTPNAPQAEALRNYVKQTEQKIWLKTQKDKKLNQNDQNVETEQIKEQDVWKSISLDNLGFQLIFYNISSKFRTEDNQDLCILLNEWRLNNMRRLENKLSFKMNLVTDDDELRNSKQNKFDDILVQDAMRNMEFEPKVESDRDWIFLNQQKMTKKTMGKTLMGLNKLAKQQKMRGFFGNNSLNKTLTEEDLQGLDEQEIRSYYKKIKEMFKYAKMNLPETFESYVKNSSGNNWQFISFEGSQFSSEHLTF